MLRLTCTIKQPLVPQDFYVPLPVRFSYLLQGKDQEIERYIAEETAAALPPVRDLELVRLRADPSPGFAQQLQPCFYDPQTQTQRNDYLAAGLDARQIQTMSQALARSLYIFELYDSADTDQRVLLARSFAKANDAATYVAAGDTNLPLLQLSQQGLPTPLSALALPTYFLLAQPQGTVYLQLWFFNSATGKKLQLRSSLPQASSAQQDYLPLSYSAATRTYALPPSDGQPLALEQKLLGTTSLGDQQAQRQASAGAERATGPRGAYQPLTPETLPDGSLKFPALST